MMRAGSAVSDAGAQPRRISKAGLAAALVVGLVLQAALRRRTAALSVVEFSQARIVTSGVWLRRLSLGYEGLLADIYWTRAIQYFGINRLSGRSQFNELDPLLRITTELDPRLIAAYRFGAIFLAEKPPAGAGRPQEAMQLLRRGLAANPDYWRFWEDLGFIEYWDLHDYPMAARYFRAGSERPGAPLWMKTVAAAVAAKGGELRISQALWTDVYRNAANATVRQSAISHLAGIRAAEDIQMLNQKLASYAQRAGKPARSFEDLVSAGDLPGLPVDPTDVPYSLRRDGKAGLGKGSKINLSLAK